MGAVGPVPCNRHDLLDIFEVFLIWFPVADNGLGMSVSDDHRGAYLRNRLREDRLVLLSVALVGFHFLGLLVLIQPLTSLTTVWWFGKRLSADKAADMRRIHNLPASLRLRVSDRADCFVASAFGIAVLMVSKDLVDLGDAPDARMKIAHEVGHLGRADLVSSEALIVASVFGFIVILFPLLLAPLGVVSLGDGLRAYLHLLLYLGVFLVGMSFLRRLHVTRELLADSDAKRQEPEAFAAFLRGRAQRERHIKPRHPILAWANRLSHPTFAERFRFQTEDLPEPHRRNTWRAAVVGAVPVFAVYLSVSDYIGILNVPAWLLPTEDIVQGNLMIAALLAPVLGLLWALGAAVILARLITQTKGAAALPSPAAYFAGAISGAATIALIEMFGA